MRSTPFLQITPASCIPPYLPSTKSHNLITSLVASVRRINLDSRSTTLDLSLAAHILLLLDAPLPDPLLSSLLSSSYPALISHARRVLGAAAPSARVLPPERYRPSALLPYPSFRSWWNEPRRPKT